MIVELVMVAVAGILVGAGAGAVLASRQGRERLTRAEARLAEAETEFARATEARLAVQAERDDARASLERAEAAETETREELDHLQRRVLRLNPEVRVRERQAELDREGEARLAALGERLSGEREAVVAAARQAQERWMARLELGEVDQQQIERWTPVVTRLRREEPELIQRAWQAVGLPSIQGGE